METNAGNSPLTDLERIAATDDAYQNMKPLLQIVFDRTLEGKQQRPQEERNAEIPDDAISFGHLTRIGGTDAVLTRTDFTLWKFYYKEINEGSKMLPNFPANRNEIEQWCKLVEAFIGHFGLQQTPPDVIRAYRSITPYL